MVSQAVSIAVAVATVGSALIAGVFFAFSTFVITALSRLPAEQGVAAMQSIAQQRAGIGREHRSRGRQDMGSLRPKLDALESRPDRCRPRSVHRTWSCGVVISDVGSRAGRNAHSQASLAPCPSP